MLQDNLDRTPETQESATVLDYPNVRGRDYFH